MQKNATSFEITSPQLKKMVKNLATELGLNSFDENAFRFDFFPEPRRKVDGTLVLGGGILVPTNSGGKKAIYSTDPNLRRNDDGEI